MSIHRLLDEAVIKGGYSSKYAALDALLASAGFVYEPHSKGTSRILRWVMQDALGYTVRINALKFSDEAVFKWQVFVYGIPGMEDIDVTAVGNSLVGALERAAWYIPRKPVPAAAKPFLDALDKLKKSPLLPTVDALFNTSNRPVEEAVLKGGYDSTIGGWAARALRAAGFTKDGEVEDRWILDSGLVTYKLTIHRSAPVYSVVVRGPRYNDTYSVYSDSLDRALVDALKRARGYGAEYAALKIKKFAAAYPPPHEDTSMLS